MKGSEFIKRIRKIAKDNGVAIQIESKRDKGSHATLYYGNRYTIMKDRKKELGEGLLNKMLRQSGLDKEDLK